MELKQIYNDKNSKIFSITSNEIGIGAVEVTINNNSLFIDNIHIIELYRGKGYLRQIINTLSKHFNTKLIICLPLPQHIEKFKHLGFKLYKTNGEDNFYSLNLKETNNALCL